MTTSPYLTAADLDPVSAAPAAPACPASSRLLLWLPVLAVVAMAWLQVHSFQVLSAGAPDLDPLYGLLVIFTVAADVVIGVIDLVCAVAFSFAGPESRAGAGLGLAIWTACAGAGFVAVMAPSIASDPALVGSSTAGDQVVWDVAAAAVALLPLVVVLLVRVAARTRR